jgi:diacylglycerol kinase (ATP)
MTGAVLSPRPMLEGSAVQRIWNATVNTWNGLCFVFRSEAAFRQEAAVFMIALPLAFLITAEPWKRFILLATILIVMIVELLNSAIEKLADHVAPKRHNRIKNVKDMGSAAVGLALLVAGITWLLAIWEWAAVFL